LHLVQFLRKVFLVQGLFKKSQRWFLVDQCHFAISMQ
jgi:hypothetical protein